MIIEFPKSNIQFNNLKEAENHLAFEHFPVDIIVDGKKGTFDCFTLALEFLHNNIK